MRKGGDRAMALELDGILKVLKSMQAQWEGRTNRDQMVDLGKGHQ